MSIVSPSSSSRSRCRRRRSLRVGSSGTSRSGASSTSSASPRSSIRSPQSSAHASGSPSKASMPWIRTNAGGSSAARLMKSEPPLLSSASTVQMSSSQVSSQPKLGPTYSLPSTPDSSSLLRRFLVVGSGLLVGLGVTSSSARPRHQRPVVVGLMASLRRLHRA